MTTAYTPYVTDFEGYFVITPPLSETLRRELSSFFENPRRRLQTAITKLYGVSGESSSPPALCCPLRLKRNASSVDLIEWNPSCECASGLVDYLHHVIASYLTPHGHVARGTMRAQGEDFDDQWTIKLSSSGVVGEEEEKEESTTTTAAGKYRVVNTVITVKRFGEDSGGDYLDHRVASTWLKPLSEREDYLKYKRSMEEEESLNKSKAKKTKRTITATTVDNNPAGEEVMSGIRERWKRGTLADDATVAELKSACKLMGLKVGGNKSELLARLVSELDGGDVG